MSDQKKQGTKKRPSPISYRPPESLREAFKARVEQSGLSQSGFITKAVFGDDIPKFGSSKSMCGHSLGATGVHEAIHCLLMLKHDFIAPSINVNEPDEGVAGLPLVTERVDNAGLNTAMTNSFGFGGTNGTLVFQKV